MNTRSFAGSKVILLTAVVLWFGVASVHSVSAVPNGSQKHAFQIAATYLKAIQARDFAMAYSYISDTDQSVRDKASYLRSQENLHGFALEISKRLVAGMTIWPIQKRVGSDKAHFDLGYRVPTGDEISAQLFDWNATKVNALSKGDQRQILARLENLGKSGKMITLQGYESFDLVRQKDGWRIFLDWRSRSRVVFNTIKPGSGELEVDFLRNDFLVANNEPFQIDFMVRNNSHHTIVATLNHIVEPRRLAENLEMIACGSLLPIQLRPGETREISSSYILGGEIAPQTRLLITYEFALQRATDRKPTFQSRKGNPGYSNVRE